MKQAQKSAMSREYIIETAIAEFNKNGYAKASINSICRDGEISKGKLYHYFESKDMLYFECVAYCFNLIAEHLDKYEVSADNSFEETILEFHIHWQSFWKKHPEMIILMAESKLLPPPSLVKEMFEFRKEKIETRIKTNVRRIVEPYVPEDDAERLRLLTNCIWVAIDYIASNIGVEKYALEGLYDEFFNEQNEMFRSLVHLFLHVDISKYNKNDDA